MATGYTRQSSGDIVDGNTITAAQHNNEYNAVQAAMDATNGHNHDGTVGGGAPLPPTALVGVGSNGMVARVDATTFAARTITAPAAGITVTNGGGVAGNPTLALANDLAAVEALASTGLAARTASDTWTVRTLTAPAAGITVSNGDGVSGNPTIALANDLAAVEGLSGTGLAVRTASDTWTVRTLTAPAAGITVTNGGGVAGNPTLALANDLAAVEGLSGTGLAVRTASDTWASRTIAGTANEITVTNGDGVSGNPTISIPAAVTMTGKTVTGGTFNNISQNIVTFGTGSLFLEQVSGSPEGVETAPVGSIACDNTNGVIYYKASGTGNTGWRAMSPLTGTWTPTLVATTTPGTQGYTTQSGNWRRIGNIVFASFRLNLSSIDAAAAGNWEIGGLPFTPAATTVDQVGITLAVASGYTLAASTSLSGGVNGGTASVRLLEVSNTGLANITVASGKITASLALRGSMIYYV